MKVFRSPLLFPAAIVLLAFFPLPSAAQRGPGSQLFARYPFDKWAAENAKPQIRWNVRIDPARLSPHQRLVTQLHVSVDGAEIQKGHVSGQMLVLVRIEDSAGHRYQTGNQTSFPLLQQDSKIFELSFNISAFMRPGDYVVSIALCDSGNLEHNFIRRPLHVAPINSDPLPDAWTSFPPVEFLPVTSPPDAWYLPQIRSHIALAIDTQRPVRVEVLVNTTPTALGSAAMFRDNMELVVPSLMVLAGIAPVGGSTGLSIIDLNRRTLTYERADLSPANWRRDDWGKLRRVFTEFSAATVDAKTLIGQRKMLDYFSAEVGRRLGSASPVSHSDPARVLIVLSAPVFFSQQDKAPLPDLPPDPDRRVFYIRYAPGGVPGALSGGSLYMFTDDLERLLKPMGARVFRVIRPEDFRKALGSILDEIGRIQASR